MKKGPIKKHPEEIFLAESQTQEEKVIVIDTNNHSSRKKKKKVTHIKLACGNLEEKIEGGIGNI